MHVQANMLNKPTSCLLTERVIPFFTDFTFLFMLVSAFSMCCGYYERIKNGMIKPKDFYSKRYKRVLPFFALMVVLSVLMDRNWTSVREGFLDITLCFNLLPNPNIATVGVGWFLGTVFTFYMLFPFFTYLLNSKQKSWFILFISLVFSYISFRYYDCGRSNIIYSAPFFVSGGLIYLYREELVGFVNSKKYISAIFVVVSLVVLFMLDVDHYPVFRNVLMFTIITIYAIGSSDSILNNRAVRYLSKISMEIYLCHMMFYRISSLLHLDRWIQNDDVLYVVTCCTTLIGAIIFSHVAKFHLLPYISDVYARTYKKFHTEKQIAN